MTLSSLTGLVLAGGRSVRMGRDKALLVYDGEPQLLRAHRLLANVCTRVLVSVRSDQVATLGGSGLRPRSSDRGETPLLQGGSGLRPRSSDRGETPLLQGGSGLRPRSSFADFEVVVDDREDAGPVAGLLAAWQRVPDCALLVLAVDLPLVDVPTLRLLLEARYRSTLATCFEHPDGTLEPLCTLWEAAAEPILRARARNSNVSLRRVLESSTVTRIKPPDPAVIRSANTPEDDAELRGLREL